MVYTLEMGLSLDWTGRSSKARASLTEQEVVEENLNTKPF